MTQCQVHRTQRCSSTLCECWVNLATENCSGVHLERQRRTKVCTTSCWDHQTVRTPTLGRNIRPCINGCESRYRALRQVHSTQWSTSILRELLTVASIGWSILSHDCNEPIGMTSVDRVNLGGIIIRPCTLWGHLSPPLRFDHAIPFVQTQHHSQGALRQYWNQGFEIEWCHDYCMSRTMYVINISGGVDLFPIYQSSPTLVPCPS